MASNISVDEAKQIVRRATKRWGHLSEEMMNDIEQWRPEYRREIDENWLSLENAASHSVKTLAKEIYGSSARFVFELLQNADDNSFTKASKNRVVPFILFKVYNSRIIVECNEDGFTAKDLDAICSVGQSTKSAKYGYIGAKGIGFKSVFIAAYNVYIQSGNFSFKFTHKRDDPGLGMVRPIWVDSKEKLTRPLTRMTLQLHDDPFDSGGLKDVIFEQLQNLQQTCLLFLSNLKEIRVEQYDGDDNLTLSTRFSKTAIDDFRVRLDRSSSLGGQTTTESQVYHMTKQRASNLAWSDRRAPPTSNDAKQAASTAEVVLAFPLTEDYRPMCTTRQELFAFLPVRSHDYKFIIHSDFDTAANRQDIVTTSKRNCGLRYWIADAFVTAVRQFCKHSTLCYDWPLFLPTNEHSGWDDFWAGLNAELHMRLTESPVVKSRNEAHLRLISDVRILPDDVQLGGKPLFNDEVEDPYLSPKYSREARTVLKSYGLQVQSTDEVVDLLEMDIRGQTSSMHGSASEQWHSAVAKLFCGWLDKKWTVTQRLKSIPLIPLRGGGWRSAKGLSVYFPTTSGTEIPQKLDLEVVNPTAAANRDRRALFERLGVSEAKVWLVRDSIFTAFDTSKSVTLADSRSYLHFLYRTHQPGSPPSELSRARIFTEATRRCWPQQKDVYVSKTANPYNAKNLLSATDSAPGLPVRIVHSTYMVDVPSQTTPGHPTWERWLYDSIGVHERLRLIARDGRSLSEAFLYVLKHRSDAFLGLFEHLWVYESHCCIDNEQLRRQICELPAKDLCKVNYALRLRDAWLPLNDLKGEVSRYMEDSNSFPFLKIDESEMTDEFASKWRFLCTYFSVGHKENLSFLLEILHRIEKACHRPSSISQTQQVYELYVAIVAKFSVQKDSGSARRKLKKFFSKGGILVPYEETPVWAKISECLWNAPANFVSKHSLRSLYRRTVGKQDMNSLEQLFHQALEIPSASVADILTELETIQSAPDSDATQISELYKYLRVANPPASSLSPIFSQKALIMVQNQGQRGWYKTSDTLWSSSTAIRGKVTLDTQYDELKDFFVTKLGVKSLTLDMVYNELLQGPASTQEEVRVTMLSLSNFLRSERALLDPNPIRIAKIFPAKYGDNETVLLSASADFAIADRAHLKERFGGKIALLDFDMEDIRQLGPFFAWVGLDDRYLSNSVKEITSVAPMSGSSIRIQNRNLCLKAYYILRVAATFGSPRYHLNPTDFYRLLRNMKTLESDDIHVTLQLSQNGKAIPIEDDSPNVHIDYVPPSLTIYVPRKKRAQDICFSSILPRKFLRWLMDYPDTRIEDHADAIAVNALNSILACDRLVLPDILDRQGIIQIEIEDKDLPSSEDTEEYDDPEQSDEEAASVEEAAISPAPVDGVSDTETLVETVGRSYMARDAQRVSSGPPSRPMILNQAPSSSVIVDAATSSQSRLQSRFGVGSVPQLGEFTFTAPQTGFTEDGRYRALLERVVAAAQAASFPSSGAFNLDSLRDALFSELHDDALYSFDGFDVVSGLRSATQFERDKRVGAAGELYVFELLSKLGFPGWSRENWQSTIRTYVRAHPQYSGIERWPFRETADLVYNDEQGRLTEFLIDSGYLARDEWQQARPRYFLEVKTTTGECDMPFYMSGNQYRLMQSKHQSQDKSEVYMVLRVFGLNARRMGMRAYLDPEDLRRKGQLVFTGRTWSVLPGNGTPPDRVCDCVVPHV